MSKDTRIIIVNNVKLPINASHKEAFIVARRRLSSLGVKVQNSDCYIYRKSVDARRKTEISFVYSVACKSEADINDERLSKNGMARLLPGELTPIISGNVTSAPPVVVGTGPAGLFAALLLAEHGYAPIVLERGGSVKERHEAVRRLREFKILDPNTNIQFGAGGAGTFSDGKLVTRVNDPLLSYVLSRFVEFGAPEDIKFIAKPHIGTDILSVIVDRMLLHIESLGGKVLYNTKFLSVCSDGGVVKGVVTDKGEIDCSSVILAIGHSARDTYEYLINAGFAVEPKPFSVGMRIEHRTEDIDRAMYGSFAGDPRLSHAEYALSHNTKERGVYTFCMCPGGEVVAATSEEGGVVVNGMSENARSGVNSNSAVVCSVFREDYGNTPISAIEFQRKIERAAFTAGGSDYSAPIITVSDFLDGTLRREPKRIIPTYMNGNGVRLARPESYLPEFTVNAIKGALSVFDKKIEGFASADAVLTGAETRTSAPIRILRNPETHLAVGFKNFYPAGEGAGYAGGISSAALDGIKVALSLMKEIGPLK
ncbi:MAG: hypothetical protein IJX92_02750 [Clostridia bacterium]|nr:hypothetical protein [Clostridia bacterium]